LAASSRGKAITLARAKAEGDAKAFPTFRGRGRGDRGVRGSIGQLAPWEENAHARRAHAPETVRKASKPRQHGNVCPATIRRSVHECRETLGPPVNRTEPKTPWGVHAAKVA